MSFIEQASQIPEPYDLASFSRKGEGHFDVNWGGQMRQMANKSDLGFSSAVFRKKFRVGMTVRNYRDNEVIFAQGDAADAVFYIQSGTVKLTVTATRRKKAIVAVLLRGSFFGEGCLGKL
jgi:CRP-like cAMP-binding protein